MEIVVKQRFNRLDVWGLNKNYTIITLGYRDNEFIVERFTI